jgi:flagellar basal-body rod protein FlgB
MLNRLFNSTTIPVLEQVVNFAQTRHAILAGNIANLDTPGYRAKDISPEKFEARLKDALIERDRAAESPSMANVSQPDPFGEMGTALEDVLYHDDSTGSIEKQVAAISKNQMQHNLALSIMTSQFRLLQTAISERV